MSDWKDDPAMGAEVIISRLEDKVAQLEAYCDKLADGLPEGMLPKDVEVLQNANAEFAKQLAQLEAMLERYADKNNWGYYDESGCPKGHGKYTDACFLGVGPAMEALGDREDISVASSDGAER